MTKGQLIKRLKDIDDGTIIYIRFHGELYDIGNYAYSNVGSGEVQLTIKRRSDEKGADR